MRKPTVGCVVPVLNEAQALPELIGRLRQLRVDELIIVDGGSTDGTQDLLRDSGLKWISCEPGRALQMNAGSAGVQSDILLFIHADTNMPSSHIDIVRAVMIDAQYVGGRFDVRLSGTHPLFRLIEGMMNLRSRLTKICTGDQCLFVRRSVFEQLGGFPDQPLMEDVEFTKRLKRAGKIVCLHEKVVTSSRRWQQFGIFRTVTLMWKLRLLYWLGSDPGKLSRMYRQAR